MPAAAPERVVALAAIASKVGCTSIGEPEMTRRISAVAVCCSRASSRSASASSSRCCSSALACLSSATSSSSVGVMCLLRRALLSTRYYLDRHPLHPRRRYESIIFSSGASRRLDLRGLARSHRLKSTMFFFKKIEYPLADEWCDVFPTSKSRCSFHARNRSPDLEKPTLTAKFIAVVVARDLYVLRFRNGQRGSRKRRPHHPLVDHGLGLNSSILAAFGMTLIRSLRWHARGSIAGP